MLLQAAGLAQKSGDNLKPTPAGRKALSGPASEAIRSRLPQVADEHPA